MLLVGPIWAYLNICVLESTVQNLVSPFYKIYFGPQMLFTVFITRAARKKTRIHDRRKYGDFGRVP